jgi:hypothetical protein
LIVLGKSVPSSNEVAHPNQIANPFNLVERNFITDEGHLALTDADPD